MRASTARSSNAYASTAHRVAYVAEMSPGIMDETVVSESIREHGQVLVVHSLC